MESYSEILLSIIKGEDKISLIPTTKIRDDAYLMKAYYTGKGQEAVLYDYRKNETKPQKDQRKRITIARSKAVMGNIENLLDQLHILDTPGIKITAKTKQDELKTIVYSQDVQELAFKYVKYYNLVDANAFLIGGVNELNEPEFSIIDSSNIIHYRIKNEQVQYLVTKHGDKEYRLYYEKGVIIAKKGTGGGYSITNEINTGLNYAYPLGFLLDASTNFKTYKTITDVASELFKQLVWDGSELDTIKATHGIIKTFAYAPKCDFHTENDEGIIRCVEGQLTGADSGVCQACNGTGMKIHTSSQDIIYMPEPLSPETSLPLDKLIHTITIPDNILETRKNDIKQTENAIIRSIFNGNSIERSDIAKTATEASLDAKGLFAMFSKLGFKVSNTYIWMVEVIADIIGAQIETIHHGYSLDTNISTIDDLLDQRAKAINSGASQDIVEVIDYAIQKKQHTDDPTALNQFAIWDQHRPFRDKTLTEKSSIIATLPDDNKFKLLHVYWSIIQVRVEQKYKSDFYDFDFEKQSQLIFEEVEKLKSELPEPEMIDIGFNEF
jgi:hypothetical protein